MIPYGNFSCSIIKKKWAKCTIVFLALSGRNGVR